MKIDTFLSQEDNFIKLYKFTCSLPKEQSYMLSYLIDVEKFAKSDLPEYPDYFECCINGFINGLLSGWSCREIASAINKLIDSGYISKITINNNRTYLKLNIEKIEELNNEYKIKVAQNAALRYKKCSDTLQKDQPLNNYNKEVKSNKNISSTPILGESSSPTEDSEHSDPESDKYITAKAKSQMVVDVITYLNQVCGTHFRTNSSGNVRPIKSRINEGYSLQDFKNVIEWKYKEWGEHPVKFSNGYMSNDYLRPATLFGNKFDGYLQQANNNLKRTDSEKIVSAPLLEPTGEVYY